MKELDEETLTQTIGQYNTQLGSLESDNNKLRSSLTDQDQCSQQVHTKYILFVIFVINCYFSALGHRVVARPQKLSFFTVSVSISLIFLVIVIFFSFFIIRFWGTIFDITCFCRIRFLYF